MVPFTVHSSIAAPREEVFDFVADMAHREAWWDHCGSEFRLEHPVSTGVGAAVRFRLGAGGSKSYLETQIVEAERPRRIVEATRSGRLGRTRGEIVYDLSRQGRHLTRVEMTVYSEPATVPERLRQRLGGRRWMRRQVKLALQRLRAVFEERPDEPLARTTVAGWEPQKAPRFGAELAGQRDVHTGSGERASSG
jgi:uncharacterized protein YndB with AHSA1/START domain